MSGPDTWHTNIVSAARTLLLTVVKATTGTLADLSVAGGVFSRASGSFITDGFSVGDEIVSTGFAAENNVVANITAMTSDTMTVDATLTNATAVPGCAIVAGLPQQRAWETERAEPLVNRAYVADAYENLPSRPVGIGGFEAHEILAIFTLEYPQSSGRRALSLMAGKVRSAFRPRSGLYYDGDAGTFLGASVGRIVPMADWSMQTITARIVGHTGT